MASTSTLRRQSSEDDSNLCSSASQAVLTLLTPEQIEYLVDTFSKLDTNQDGYVDSNEIMNMLMATFPEAEADVLEELRGIILDGADRDRDGKINLKEYLVSIACDQGILPTHVEVLDEQVQSIMAHLSSEEIDMFRDAFIRIDRNGDGYVDREEMMDAVERVVGDRFEALKGYLDKIYDVADKDVDGKLNLTEFLASFAEGPGVVPHEVVISSVQSVRIRLTDDEIAALQDSFNTMDRNHDGLIDPSELKYAFKCSAAVRKNPDITEADIDDMVARAMKAADQDKDGFLTLAEFIRSYQEDQNVLPEIFTISAVQRIHSSLSQEELDYLREAFMELDENGDGWLDEEELTRSLHATLQQVLKSDAEITNFIRLIIASADRNDDGKLSLGEFVEAFAQGSAALDIPLIVAGERIQTAMNELRELMIEDDIRKLSNVFTVLDENKDGYLERAELENIMTSLIQERYPEWNKEQVDRVITAILNAADTNHDGKLSLTEFIRSFYEGEGVLPADFVEDVANAIDEAIEEEEQEEQNQYDEVVETTRVSVTVVAHEELKAPKAMPAQLVQQQEPIELPSTPTNEDEPVVYSRNTAPTTSAPLSNPLFRTPIAEETQQSDQLRQVMAANANHDVSSVQSSTTNSVKKANRPPPPPPCDLPSPVKALTSLSQGLHVFSNDVSGCPVSHEQLWDLFTQYDEDGSGLLNRGEFMRLYRSFEHYGLPPSDREIDAIFTKYDTRGDGKLDFNEFAIIMLQRSRM